MASVLVVCTGNICRSPMAEGFLRAALERRFGDAAPLVASAGVIGRDGAAAEPEAVRAAAERGVDIGHHVVRRLRREHIAAADLVVAMAAEHREAVVDAVPAAAGDAFTLKELVRLLEALPEPEPAPDVDALVRGRVRDADDLRRGGFVPNRHDEDVVDPLGMPLETFRAVAWELESWSERLVVGLAGTASAPSTAGAAGA